MATGTMPHSDAKMFGMSKKKPDTNSPEEPGRTRLICDTEEVVNAAVQLRASKQSAKERRKVSKSDVVNAILRDSLKVEIEEILKYFNK